MAGHLWPRHSALGRGLYFADMTISQYEADVLAYLGQETALLEAPMAGDHEFSGLVAVALRNELGDTRRTIKTIMRWTGASERTVKNWLSATHGPSGEHLLKLAQHSDEVFELVLVLCDRRPVLTTYSLVRLRAHLAQTIERLDRHIV